MATAISLFSLDGFISTSGAARAARYSPRMVRHLIESGQLPAERNGKRAWRIRLADLQPCLRRRDSEGKCRRRR